MLVRTVARAQTFLKQSITKDKKVALAQDLRNKSPLPIMSNMSQVSSHDRNDSENVGSVNLRLKYCECCLFIFGYSALGLHHLDSSSL